MGRLRRLANRLARVVRSLRRRRNSFDEGGATAAMNRPAHVLLALPGKIRVEFDVPLPRGGADPVLRDLLLHHAVEIVREHQRRGDKLDGIDVIEVTAKLDGMRTAVGSIDLGTHTLPEIEMPHLLPSGGPIGPLGMLGSTEETDVLPLADAKDRNELDRVGVVVRLTAGLDAAFRARGIDPNQMTVTDLAVVLLETAGYSLTRRADGMYVAVGHGSSSLVSIVAHQPGSYPELAEKDIADFLVSFATSHTDRGLLITDKFGPYLVHKKERANPRCSFITRERLQPFVDSVAIP